MEILAPGTYNRPPCLHRAISTRSPSASNACSCATKKCSAPTRCCRTRSNALTRERDALKSRLAAARTRLDALLEQLPADPSQDPSALQMKQIEVQIMGQSYLLGCPEGGEAHCATAVERVDAAMCKIRDAGKVKARDRIAVLASLNLAFDLAQREATRGRPRRHAPTPSRPPARATPARQTRDRPERRPSRGATDPATRPSPRRRRTICSERPTQPVAPRA